MRKNVRLRIGALSPMRSRGWVMMMMPHIQMLIYIWILKKKCNHNCHIIERVLLFDCLETVEFILISVYRVSVDVKYILLFAVVLLSDSAPLFSSTVLQCLLDPLFCFNSGSPLFIFTGCPLVNKWGKKGLDALHSQQRAEGTKSAASARTAGDVLQ